MSTVVWQDPVGSVLPGLGVVGVIRRFSSVLFSVSDSSRPHEPQHTRPPCPSPTPRVYPNSCPLSRWCHPAISSSLIPFSSSPQSFPASGSFQMSQLFASGAQSIGLSASTSSPSSEHSGLLFFRIDWLDLLAILNCPFGKGGPLDHIFCLAIMTSPRQNCYRI